MSFFYFKKKVAKKFESLAKEGKLFFVDINKDELWETYIASFPNGTNPIFKERTEHDCSACRHFIKTAGGVVAIKNNNLESIWDIEISEEESAHYQEVANAMSVLVKSKPVKNVFIHYEKNIGTDFNHQEGDDGKVIKWNHFHYKLPTAFVIQNKIKKNKTLSDYESGHKVFKRSLDEVSIEAINTTIELIDQNSIYRGQENKAVVEAFCGLKTKYDTIKKNSEKDLFCWNNIALKAVTRIKNTAIGTLLVDLSDGKEVDDAVRMFESKVAPMNYKRPTAPITKSMIKNAQEKVKGLGIEESLYRRHATIGDITVNNILFANRDAKIEMDVFNELSSAVPEKPKDLKKIEEVDIKTFIDQIIPKINTVELLFENKHINNLVSLIAPTEKEADPIFKWNNNFSWCYNGEVTDSIKERVKKAGGNISGILRCSLSWFNYDDLDIHVREPSGNEIMYSNCRKPNISTSTGQLDVDMNAGSGETRNGVENIVWTNKNKMLEGEYHLFIHQYQKRETIDFGFDAEIEYDGKIYSFSYDKPVSGNVSVAKFKWTKKSGLEIIESLPSTELSKEVWGITTNKFHKVSLVMNSPNHWDGNGLGNKHFFFILNKCINQNTARGFFNEFLREDLRQHRKVFEVLGAKMKVEKSATQISGLGFSSTIKNQIVARVTGSFTRTLKINF